jgi:hypothetical protein
LVFIQTVPGASCTTKKFLAKVCSHAKRHRHAHERGDFLTRHYHNQYEIGR